MPALPCCGKLHLTQSSGSALYRQPGAAREAGSGQETANPCQDDNDKMAVDHDPVANVPVPDGPIYAASPAL